MRCLIAQTEGHPTPAMFEHVDNKSMLNTNNYRRSLVLNDNSMQTSLFLWQDYELIMKSLNLSFMRTISLLSGRKKL